MLVTDIIRLGAERHGPRTAVRFGDTQATFTQPTFTQVDRLSGAIAAELARILPPGGRIGLLTANAASSIAIDFACAKARLVRVPLNARLSAAEHRVMLARMDVPLLLHAPGLADRAAELAAGIEGLVVQDADDLAASAAPHRDGDFVLAPDPDDIVAAIYTSGTSGTLKAVLHSQRTYAAVAMNVLGNLVDPRAGDAMLHAASLIHASGTFVLPFWLRGAAADVLPGFDPASFIDAIERWRPTALMLVPTMLAMLMDDPGFVPEKFGSVDTILYGASPMPRPLIERALAAMGPRFVQFYGQTEAPLAIASLTREDHLDPARLLACGRTARDCEIRIVGEDGADVATGAEGEIALRAPFRMVGYHDDDALNAETFLPGGWMRTRDVGRMSPDGYLTLVDRTSDMIVSGGYNVYPKEVEDALLAHADVAEAVVVGLPDTRWGEAVTGFVVLRPGAPVDPAALIAHCRTLVAAYKAPKSIRFIDAVPKSAVGKPLRRAIRDPFWVGHERRI